MANKTIGVDFPNKTTPVSNDTFSIADSEDWNNTKDIEIGSLPYAKLTWGNTFSGEQIMDSTLYVPKMYWNATNWIRLQLEAYWKELVASSVRSDWTTYQNVFWIGDWDIARTRFMNTNVLIWTTSAWRSILRVVWLPTTSSWLSSWDLYNDSGTLKIV